MRTEHEYADAQKMVVDLLRHLAESLRRALEDWERETADAEPLAYTTGYADGRRTQARFDLALALGVSVHDVPDRLADLDAWLESRGLGQ